MNVPPRLAQGLGGFIYEVEAFSKERSEPTPPVPQPEVGLRWGKKSDFSYLVEEHKQTGGGSSVSVNPRMRNPWKDKSENQVEDWSPIHTEYDVYRLYDEGMEDYIEVMIATAFTILKSSRSQRYINGYTFRRIGGEDGSLVREPQYDERNVDLYIRFTIPSQQSELVRATYMRREEVGDRPQPGYT